jgi:hypothetical protein
MDWMISRLLPTQILLIPVHALEALSVRYRFSETLYHWMAPAYQSIRPLFYFGEEHFEGAVRAGELQIKGLYRLFRASKS